MATKPKFEYSSDWADDLYFVTHMNKMGAKGWVLAAASREENDRREGYNRGYRFFWKRRVSLTKK